MIGERRGDGAPPGAADGEGRAPVLEPPLGPDAGPAEHESVPRRSPRRRSPLLAALVVVACAWLLRELWPDAAYFFSPGQPIDLGRAGAYHPERAQPNRLVRVVVGSPAAIASATAASGEERLLVGIAGTDLVLDRARGAPVGGACEGRLLPPARTAGYAGPVAELERRGFRPSGPWAVVREGERPRQSWSRPLLAAAVIGLAALNLWALMRRLAVGCGGKRATALE